MSWGKGGSGEAGICAHNGEDKGPKANKVEGERKNSSMDNARTEKRVR